MDEVTKQKLLFAVIAFSLTVALYQIVFNLSAETFQWSSLLLRGFPLGLLVGGIVFGVMHFLQR